ncbi:hypothetical protein [Pseudomonas monsensis]|uniref:hypothetical protein n=1 Tax=Pseudomonas monsensis TaxID=2745509 RepID=UPI00300F53D1
MIGTPLPDPRDQITDHLNQALEQFFGTGKKIQHVDSGVSGERELTFGTAHGNKLRAKREKIAPELKRLSDSGANLYQACTELKIGHKRAVLIASENKIKFKDS